jgi:hypothetical protein
VKNLSKVRVAALGAVGLAGVIAPLALAGSASAAPVPNANNVIEVTGQAKADQLMAQGVISKNVDVPVGVDVQLRWVDIQGNLSVEGKLSLASSQIEGNATVSGPGAGLSLFNDPGNHFYANLTVNTAGGYYDGSWINTGLGVYSNGQQVDGTLSFTNNSGSRMSLNCDPGTMTVHNFTYSGNAQPFALPYVNTGGLTITGHQTIS